MSLNFNPDRAPAQFSSAKCQPLHVAQFDDALLKLQTVRAMTGLSDSTIYRKVAAGDMPAPIRLSARCTRWRAGDVTNWLRAQAAAAKA